MHFTRMRLCCHEKKVSRQGGCDDGMVGAKAGATRQIQPGKASLLNLPVDSDPAYGT